MPPPRFCQGLDGAALAPIAPRMAKDLGPFLLETTDDTLMLVMETLSSVIGIEKGTWLSTDLASDLMFALLDVWKKNIKGKCLTFG
jgi:importin-9